MFAPGALVQGAKQDGRIVPETKEKRCSDGSVCRRHAELVCTGHQLTTWLCLLALLMQWSLRPPEHVGWVDEVVAATGGSRWQRWSMKSTWTQAASRWARQHCCSRLHDSDARHQLHRQLCCSPPCRPVIHHRHGARAEHRLGQVRGGLISRRGAELQRRQAVAVLMRALQRGGWPAALHRNGRTSQQEHRVGRRAGTRQSTGPALAAEANTGTGKHQQQRAAAETQCHV